MRRSGPLRAKVPLRQRKALRRSRDRDTPAQMRADVLARDMGCRGRALYAHICLGGVHVHHILPRGRGGRHEMDNLISVCGWMHAWIHEHPVQARTLGLLS